MTAAISEVRLLAGRSLRHSKLNRKRSRNRDHQTTRYLHTSPNCQAYQPHTSVLMLPKSPA